MRTLLLFLAACAVFGHDLYLKPAAFRLAPGQRGAVEFHNGDAFPKSESPPVLARLRDERVVSAFGPQPLDSVRVEGTMAVGEFQAPAAKGFLITARTIPNFIELPAEKFEEYLEHESLNWVIEWRRKNGHAAKPGRELYSKYVKTILHTGGPDAFVSRPVGMDIEFVPLADPAALKPGARLTVQLLFRGKPAAGVHVEASSLSDGSVRQRQLGRTGPKGTIAIPLDVPGLWKLHGILMQRGSQPEVADWESYWASLTFQVSR